MTNRREYDAAELNPKELRELAHKEYEIAKLIGPSTDIEQAWQDYCEALVSLTDSFLAKVSA